MLVSKLRDKRRTIHLRNGKTIERVIRKNESGCTYVLYNGHYIGVEFGMGEWWQVAF